MPFSRRTGRRLLAGVLGLALSLGGLWALWQLSRSPTRQVFGRIVPRVETSEPVVALTFDDGPTLEALDEIVDTLDALDVRATFFLNGVRLEEAPEAGRRLVQAGHELGNHSYSHRRMIFVSPGFVRREIERTDALIREAGHEGPIHFRPPYGKKLFVLPWFLQRTGRASIMCDLAPDSGDPSSPPDAIVRRVLDNVRAGSIILLHPWYESRETTRRAVVPMVEGLRRKGLRIVTVSELLALEGTPGAEG